MYSGNHKFRGGGRGGGAPKRNVYAPPAPPQRLSSSSTSGRLSLGGSRNPPPSSTAPATSSDESFSLVPGDPPSFAAIIRLAPDLVEEIKRVEAQGGAARIKFDANPSNALGNVIDVGGKEFRFTWAHETGGLCDIYEERHSSEDGNGLLVESGCAWRKLNVQRILDDTAKNHVKRLSEEADRQMKSRKAKLLDPSNATTKNNMKALAAAEASSWKLKHKKEFFKKKTFAPIQAGGPPKSVHKSGFASAGTAKGRHSGSSLPSPQNQSVSFSSPSMRGNVTESQAMTEDAAQTQARTKEIVGTERDLALPSSDRMHEGASCIDTQVEGAKDLQNLLITLLKQNPKGMSIKTLEKAVAERTSNSARKLEPLLKKIATLEPPDIYTLKPGVELESQKLLVSDSGSSPENSRQKQYISDDNLGQAPASDFAKKPPHDDLEDQVPMNESTLVEKIYPLQHFSDLFGDDEPPENSEGQPASSRDSGSDSDSDSSDSGSDSGSRSRSRSPAGTASGSGSDSDDDSSSNSKEGSDVEIDILNDDDKEPKKLLNAEPGLSSANLPWSMPEARPSQDGNLGDQEGYASEDIDIEKDFLGDNESELASVSRAPTTSAKKLKTTSPDRDRLQLRGVTDVHNELEVEGQFKHEHPDSLMRFKGKSKRGSNVIQLEENSDQFKRIKAGSVAQSLMAGYMGANSPGSSPDITNEEHLDNHNLQMPDSFDRHDKTNLGAQGHNYSASGKFASESLQSGRRPPVRSRDIEVADRSGKLARTRGLDMKRQEADASKHDGFLKQGDKGRRETRDGELIFNEKVNGKLKEGAFNQKQDARAEPHYEKHEDSKKLHTMGNSSSLQLGSSPNDGGQADFDRASIERKRLQRELSDLELGELREPLSTESEVAKRQFERVGSFKQSDAKLNTSVSQNADLRGRSAGKPTIDTGSPSLPNSRAGGSKNSDIWCKRRSPELSAEDAGRPAQRTVQPQQQQSRVARTEVGPLLTKAADANRLGHGEGAVTQDANVEGYGESQKKSHGRVQLEESKQDLGSRKVKGNKLLKSNTLTDAGDRRRDASSTDGRSDKRKRSGSSLDEDVSYSKYEKDEPELKGAIKNFSQYKEYVQEYCEKYESYCSLNKILENYRNEFQKLGMDLENAKGRDMERYYDILAQLRESYRQCGTRHKRLKKIFIVLHEELKHLKQSIKEFAAEYMRD